MKLYRDFISQEEIDLQYNMALIVPDSKKWMAWYPEASMNTRKELDCILDMRIGLTVDETLDIFPAEKTDAPVLLYLHGGYWSWGTSKDFSFVARGPVKQGITVAVANYSLCPKVSIGEITRQCRAAVIWLHKNIREYNGNPERIFVIGHSAGGQQVAMLLSTDWGSEYGHLTTSLRAAYPLAGSLI